MREHEDGRLVRAKRCETILHIQFIASTKELGQRDRERTRRGKRVKLKENIFCCFRFVSSQMLYALEWRRKASAYTLWQLSFIVSFAATRKHWTFAPNQPCEEGGTLFSSLTSNPHSIRI